jgi:hypothetical protein
MTENTTIYKSKLSLQDARDFGSIEAEIELSIESMRKNLDHKSIYYVEDDFIRETIKRRLDGLKKALHLKKVIFNRLNSPTEL